MRLFVAGSLLASITSIAVDPSALSVPAIVFTLVYVLLLKKLWDGERPIWWLFVIATGALLAGALTRAFDDSRVWAGVAAAAVGLMLLVTDSTRSWVARQSGAPVP